MHLKAGISPQDIDGEYVTVFTAEDPSRAFHGILVTNETGYQILRLLQSNTTPEQILTAMQALYDGDPAEMQADIESIIAQLLQAEGLEEDPQAAAVVPSPESSVDDAPAVPAPYTRVTLELIDLSEEALLFATYE